MGGTMAPAIRSPSPVIDMTIHRCLLCAAALALSSPALGSRAAAVQDAFTP